MVLESIISPENAEKHPWELFFIGFFYSSLAILVSYLIFGEEDISLLIISFTVMATSILMYRTLRYEEKKDLVDHNEWNLLKKHSKFLLFFVFLFLGFMFSFMFWYSISDYLAANFGMNTANLFKLQIKTINSINPSLAVSGNAVLSSTFWNIFKNNLGVLILSFIFSLIYGLGAIFILTWNASVLGVAIGIFYKKFLVAIASTAGFVSTHHYLSSFFISLGRFLIHGIPEMLAYFLAGLAGGLISVAIINKESNSFKVILRDSMTIFGIATVVLVISALIEVYFTLSIF